MRLNNRCRERMGPVLLLQLDLVLLPKILPPLATPLPANVDNEVLLVDNPYHGLAEAFEGRGLLDVSFDEYERAKVPMH
jgi:hypothetical protein